MPISAPPQFLSINQTAEVLGVAPMTVRRAIARGELRARKFGRRVLIDPRDLERAMKPVTSTAELVGGGHID